MFRHWLTITLALLGSAVVLGGCGDGGGSTSSRVADAPSTSSAHRSAASHLHPSGLAFASCMRSNGVPSFPDPNPGGGLSFHANPSLVSSPAFRTARAKCQKYMPGGGPLSPGPPPSAQTMEQLRQIAACMRQHGVPQFPDPRASVPPGFSPFPEYREVTNYNGAILLFPATIAMQSLAYEQALTDCHAGFLAGNNAH